MVKRENLEFRMGGGNCMKRLFVFILALSCLLTISACNAKERLKDFSATTSKNVSNIKETDLTASNDWTEQKVIEMFRNTMDDSWNIIDCVLLHDNAYDRIGALLYWDSEKETTNVAFLDATGFSKSCGVYAKTSSNAQFTYLGNGEVTFVLELQNEQIYNCKITLLVDGNNVNFTVDTDYT